MSDPRIPEPTEDPKGREAPDLSVVAPVFDEAGNLRPLHTAICTALGDRNFEVVYVNDGSTDGSREELDSIAKEDPRAKVIHFIRNYGQTAALSAGIHHSSAPLLATIDADMQNDPADIPAMLKRLDEENADVVCGWRNDRKDNFILRTLPSKIANWLISALSKVYLHDYGCTLRVYKREFIEEIPLYGEMHRFIPIYVVWAGARLIEVPVRHHPRTRGQSKYGLIRIPKVLLDLTTVKFLRDFFVTPIYFFGWVGFLMVFCGLFTGLLAIFFWGWTNQPLMAACLTIVSPLFAMVGVVEITLGIVAEVLIRMHYELQERPPYRIQTSRNFAPNQISTIQNHPNSNQPERE